VNIRLENTEGIERTDTLVELRCKLRDTKAGFPSSVRGPVFSCNELLSVRFFSVS
jgi:hypothetical protein